MKYPCVRLAEWSNLQGQQKLIVEFSSKHIGKVLDSTDSRYKIGIIYEDWHSAENNKKWRKYVETTS